MAKSVVVTKSTSVKNNELLEGLQTGKQQQWSAMYHGIETAQALAEALVTFSRNNAVKEGNMLVPFSAALARVTDSTMEALRQYLRLDDLVEDEKRKARSKKAAGAAVRK